MFSGELTLLCGKFELRKECGCSMARLIERGSRSQLWMQPRGFVSRELQRLVVHNPQDSPQCRRSSSVHARQPRLRIPAPSDIPCLLVGERRDHRRLMRRRPHCLPHTPLEAANAGDVEDRKRAMSRWTRRISRETSSAWEVVLIGTSRGVWTVSEHDNGSFWDASGPSFCRPLKSSDAIYLSLIGPSTLGKQPCRRIQGSSKARRRCARVLGSLRPDRRAP